METGYLNKGMPQPTQAASASAAAPPPRTQPPQGSVVGNRRPSGSAPSPRMGSTSPVAVPGSSPAAAAPSRSAAPPPPPLPSVRPAEPMEEEEGDAAAASSPFSYVPLSPPPPRQSRFPSAAPFPSASPYSQPSRGATATTARPSVSPPQQQRTSTTPPGSGANTQASTGRMRPPSASMKQTSPRPSAPRATTAAAGSSLLSSSTRRTPQPAAAASSSSSGWMGRQKFLQTVGLSTLPTAVRFLKRVELVRVVRVPFKAYDSNGMIVVWWGENSAWKFAHNERCHVVECDYSTRCTNVLLAVSMASSRDRPVVFIESNGIPASAVDAVVKRHLARTSGRQSRMSDTPHGGDAFFSRGSLTPIRDDNMDSNHVEYFVVNACDVSVLETAPAGMTRGQQMLFQLNSPTFHSLDFVSVYGSGEPAVEAMERDMPRVYAAMLHTMCMHIGIVVPEQMVDRVARAALREASAHVLVMLRMIAAQEEEIPLHVTRAAFLPLFDAVVAVFVEGGGRHFTHIHVARGTAADSAQPQAALVAEAFPSAFDIVTHVAAAAAASSPGGSCMLDVDTGKGITEDEAAATSAAAASHQQQQKPVVNVGMQIPDRLAPQLNRLSQHASQEKSTLVTGVTTFSVLERPAAVVVGAPPAAGASPPAATSANGTQMLRWCFVGPRVDEEDVDVSALADDNRDVLVLEDLWGDDFLPGSARPLRCLFEDRRLHEKDPLWLIKGCLVLMRHPNLHMWTKTDVSPRTQHLDEHEQQQRGEEAEEEEVARRSFLRHCVPIRALNFMRGTLLHLARMYGLEANVEAQAREIIRHCDLSPDPDAVVSEMKRGLLKFINNKVLLQYMFEAPPHAVNMLHWMQVCAKMTRPFMAALIWDAASRMHSPLVVSRNRPEAYGLQEFMVADLGHAFPETTVLSIESMIHEDVATALDVGAWRFVHHEYPDRSKDRNAATTACGCPRCVVMVLRPHGNVMDVDVMSCDRFAQQQNSNTSSSGKKHHTHSSGKRRRV